MDQTLDYPSIAQYALSTSVSKGGDMYLHQVQKQQNASHVRTYLEHLCALDIDHEPEYIRQVSIACTIGERWNTNDQILKMIKGGMNILRINLSMGTYIYFEDIISRVRAIEKSLDYNPTVGIAVDISSPPIRTGLINDDVHASVMIESGKSVVLTVDAAFKEKTSSECIWIDTQYFSGILQCVTPEDFIYLDDGMILLIVRDVGVNCINCSVIRGGELGSFTKVHLPSRKICQKTFEINYLRGLNFAVKNEVDYIFTDYVSCKSHLSAARSILGTKIKLFAKVGNKEALNNLHELMECADGIIVDRGALALVYPGEKVFQLQKQIIAKCNLSNVPVFVIAQLLDSMRFKPRATRAEITDIGNAVLDGADALVLTVETSRGLFPEKALSVLHKTCREAESAVPHERYWLDLKNLRDRFGLSSLHPSYVAALAAVEASSTSNASAILVITTSGQSASAIASFRPFCPVIAIMRRPEVGRVCHLIRGITPFVYTGEKVDNWSKDMDVRLNAAIDYAKSRGFVSPGDMIVVVTGHEAGSGSTNTVRVFELPTSLKPLTFVDSQSMMHGVDWKD